MASWRELGRADEANERADEADERAGHASVAGWSSADLALAGLRPFARYALSLRAYNRAGAGPHSSTVYATTLDGGIHSKLTVQLITFK